MLIEKPPGINTEAPISPAEAKAALRNDGQFSDEAALTLVVQDAIRAENFENMKAWVMAWPQATALYQSPFVSRYWEGTMVERANVPFYTLATTVNSIVPQIMNGLFYENPPFMIEERPGTTAEACRAWGAVLGYQLEDINFREEIRLGVTNVLLFGTGIWKIGWETFTKDRKIYVRKDSSVSIKSPLGKPIKVYPREEDIEEQIITEYVDRPTFEHIVNTRHVLVDPGLMVPDIRKAKYVIHRMYVTFNDLDKLRDRPGFNIPSREEVLEWFLPPKEQTSAESGEVTIKNPLWDARAEPRYDPTTIDPFNQQLEILEYWSEKHIISVLQKKKVICNDENEYGVNPFLSCGWWDVPEAFWSMGLAKTIGSEQRLQQGITNVWLDQAALNLNGVYKRVRGKSVPTQSIRIAPGRIVEVDNKDDFTVLERTPAVPEADRHLALSQARTEQVSGANETAMQGIAGQSGHSNIARSSAGAQLLASGAGSRAQDFVEKLAAQVIVPFLFFAHEQNKGRLPVATLHYILNDELQHEYVANGNDLIDLYGSRVRFSILAAAKMQARRAIAQQIPLIIQLLTNQQTENQLAIQKKKVDIQELFHMMFDIGGIAEYYDIVKDMTDDDLKQWQQMQMGQTQAKLQGQQKLQDQKFQNQQALVDQENTARAGREVLRHVIENAETPEATEGTEGGSYEAGL